MSESLPFLVVDADPVAQDSCAAALEPAGFQVGCFESAEAAMRHITPEFRGVVLSDISPRGMDGFALLDRVRAVNADVPTILMTSVPGRVSLAVKAMRSGAFDFIEKPFSPRSIVDIARRAIEHCKIRSKAPWLAQLPHAAPSPLSALVGDSPAMQQLRSKLASIADTSATVLLRGETGTGKELAARALHDLNPSRNGSFVALNCGGLPESLFESEVFGHEAGAFTGAARRRIGKIEHANGGTLFLDEIETMPIAFQTKLLRVLQERRIGRLGSNQELPVDFRLIAATKCDLRTLADQGAFRSDLYYRLNVAVIDLPPLRARRDDIPLLLSHFMAQASCRHKRPVPEIGSELMRQLMLHDWPGNVRELRNLSERLVLGLLPSELELASCIEGRSLPHEGTSLAEQIEQFERALLQHELRRHHGCARAAMQALHLPKRTFYDKVSKHGIRLDVYRAAH